MGSILKGFGIRGLVLAFKSRSRGQWSDLVLGRCVTTQLGNLLIQRTLATHLSNLSKIIWS